MKPENKKPAAEFYFRDVKPAQPIAFDEFKCIGCNACVNACPIDLFLPAAGSAMTPEAAYPDECWYCGCCVMECPTGAVKLTHPLMNQARWVEKASLGQANASLGPADEKVEE